MNQYSFNYGMVVSMEVNPIEMLIPCMGIAITSSSTPTVLTYFSVEKYRHDDADMNYKIRLVPFDREHFGDETIYTSDAERMLKKGMIKIVSPLVANLIKYVSTTPKEQLEKDWEELKEFNDCKFPLVEDFLKNAFSNLKK